MHTLYWAPATGTFALQVVLEELGLPYEQRLAAYLMLVLWHPGRQAVLGRFPRLAAHAHPLRGRPTVRRV